MVMDGINMRCNHIEKNTSIPNGEFLRALRLVLYSTFFTFDNIYYQQTFGTPMGSPLSPIAADIVLYDLESRALAMLPMHLPFYVRYVDDIALAAPSSMFKNILCTFNSFHPRLQFTMEEGVDNRLNFLDVSI